MGLYSSHDCFRLIQPQVVEPIEINLYLLETIHIYTYSCKVSLTLELWNIEPKNKNRKLHTHKQMKDEKFYSFAKMTKIWIEYF